MSQLSHAEDASFSHEGEDSVTATEGTRASFIYQDSTDTGRRVFRHAGRRFRGADRDV